METNAFVAVIPPTQSARRPGQQPHDKGRYRFVECQPQHCRSLPEHRAVGRLRPDKCSMCESADSQGQQQRGGAERVAQTEAETEVTQRESTAALHFRQQLQRRSRLRIIA